MVAAIIVAAGQGIRMRESLRKQYLPLAGHPILAHTLMAIGKRDLVDHIYLVVPRDDFDFCRENVLSVLDGFRNVELVAGGERRQESVCKGLQQIEGGCSIVIIHDGVRPFVRKDQIDACIEGAGTFGACILGIPAYDTLKQVDNSGNIVATTPRDAIWLAQTPQVFHYDLIKKAHDQARLDGFQGTDDASLVERLGATVKIIRGSRSNIKITNKEDLDIARALIDKKLD